LHIIYNTSSIKNIRKIEIYCRISGILPGYYIKNWNTGIYSQLYKILIKVVSFGDSAFNYINNKIDRSTEVYCRSAAGTITHTHTTHHLQPPYNISMNSSSSSSLVIICMVRIYSHHSSDSAYDCVVCVCVCVLDNSRLSNVAFHHVTYHYRPSPGIASANGKFLSDLGISDLKSASISSAPYCIE